MFRKSTHACQLYMLSPFENLVCSYCCVSFVWLHFLVAWHAGSDSRACCRAKLATRGFIIWRVFYCG